MRKWALLLSGLLLVLALALAWLFRGWNLTEKSRIIALYTKQEGAFQEAVETGDFSAVKRAGVREVTLREEGREIEFFYGGTGLVPGSSYYGILYIRDAAGDYASVFGASPEWSADGDGYRYQQLQGDNCFYYEALGNGFYYFEEHY